MFVSIEEAIIHTLTVTLSIMVLVISVIAYRRRGGRRYFALSLGFLFLTLSQAVQFSESFYLNSFIYIPYIDVHFSHLLDLATMASFAVALVARS